MVGTLGPPQTCHENSLFMAVGSTSHLRSDPTEALAPQSPSISPAVIHLDTRQDGASSTNQRAGQTDPSKSLSIQGIFQGPEGRSGREVRFSTGGAGRQAVEASPP